MGGGGGGSGNKMYVRNSCPGENLVIYTVLLIF